MRLTFCASSAPRCGPLPDVHNATISKYNSDVGSSAEVSCWLGYRFSDGESTKNLTCGDDSQWDFYGHCNGESIKHEISHFILLSYMGQVNFMLHFCYSYLNSFS